ncbi:MAG: hypothetical protein UHN88_05280 [Eubacterium sp.]|nr:hypothetical protein [Eubacterium sp.]
MEKLRVKHPARVAINANFYMDLYEQAEDRNVIDFWINHTESNRSLYLTSLRKSEISDQALQNILHTEKAAQIMQAFH